MTANPCKLPEYPVWFDGKSINESLYCQQFLQTHRLLYAENAFFTTEGLMEDETPLKLEIFRDLKAYASQGVPKKLANIIELLKICAYTEDFPPQEERIHVANGTLFLDGTFVEGKDEVVRSRLPVRYNPNAPEPARWLRFLEELLLPEDIPTLQEFMGYCMIPTNKAQRAMFIKGDGGEGKTQIGTVLKKMFGNNAKDGSIGKISENPFARADLEHIHLMIDDDMRMEALRQTNYVKSLVTAKGRMDLERKGKQSHQGYMYARLLAFCNGDLQSLYDRSGGFYRRQLILKVKEKNPNRKDDPELADKLCLELEGIFLWAFAGLQRLAANDFRFSESARSAACRETLKRDGNNVILFMEAEDYIRLDGETRVSSKELYAVYAMWCDENGFSPMKPRSFSEFLIGNQRKYGIEHSNGVYNANGRRVWGFTGIRPVIDTTAPRLGGGAYRVFPRENPFEVEAPREPEQTSI